MRVFIDNKLLREITLGQIEIPKTEQIIFGWPSLFEFLELNSVLEKYPKFDEKNEMYKKIFSQIESEFSKENLIYLYEELFAEIITQIKSLPEIQPAFLLEKIKQKKIASLSHPLAHYEEILTKEPNNALHDLILYIAWDRMCVAMAIVFEQTSSNSKIRMSLAVFQECLVESFQHITEQGRTVPSFFRLMEAFYAFHMREDNLQIHTDEEWLILCQGARALKSRDFLPDTYYIDAAVLLEHEPKYTIKVLTTDSEEVLQSGQALAYSTMRKLKNEYPFWKYTLANVHFTRV